MHGVLNKHLICLYFVQLLGIRSPSIEGGMSLAVLQPLTPSRASLSCIDPLFHPHILQCLSQVCTTDCLSLVECITKSLSSVVESYSNISLSDPTLQKRSSLPVNLLGSFHSPLQSFSSLDIGTVCVCVCVCVNACVYLFKTFALGN